MTFTIRRRGLLVGAAIAVLTIGGGVAYATIPDGAGVIHGCYDNKGTLRVIDPSAGEACKNNETPISWSQTGPAGQPGQNGTNGTNGTNGVSGYEIVQFTGPLPGGDPGTGQIDDANCPSGKKVVGGGVTVSDSTAFADSIIRYSGPKNDGSGWTAFIQRTDDNGSTATWTLSAICASVG